mgnify:FL=1
MLSSSSSFSESPRGLLAHLGAEDEEDGGAFGMSSKVMRLSVPEHLDRFNSCILAVWDHLQGPRILFWWSNSHSHEWQESSVFTVARFALVEEIARTAEAAPVEPKMSVLPDLDMVSLTFVFDGNFSGSSTKYALSLQLPHDQLGRILIIHHVVEVSMNHLSRKLLLLLEDFSPEDALPMLQPSLDLTLHHLNRLYYSGLKIPQCDKNVLLGSLESQDLAFLARIVTSHLQTHRRTVIMGRTTQEIKQFIDFLGLFLLPSEQKLSALPNCQYPKADPSFELFESRYVPEFYLQGILMESDSSEITEEELVQSIFPTTIVDLSRKIVKRCPLYNEFQAARDCILIEKEQREAELGEDTCPVTWDFPADPHLSPSLTGGQSIPRTQYEVMETPDGAPSVYVSSSSSSATPFGSSQAYNSGQTVGKYGSQNVEKNASATFEMGPPEEERVARSSQRSV